MPLALIPAPTHLEECEGAPFRFGPGTRLIAPPELDGVAGFVWAVLGPLATVTRDDGAADAVVLRPDGGTGEAYTLTVDADRVVVAGSPAGIARGVATLAQVSGLGTEGAPSGVVPALVIRDEPRYERRGLMVDVVRHFYPVSTLERVIDLLAAYKLNVLHLHLTDDQGWRIEVPGRPELVERSGRTQCGDGEAGWLRTEEYTRLVEYAAARHIEVVPELDVPGHVNAALHADGSLSPSGQPTEAYTGADVGFSKLDLSLPATARFLADVLGHLADLTPGRYLHIGGDEVHRMPREEYLGFLDHVSGAVAATGKSLIAWQEAAAAGLPSDALVQLWDSNADPAPVVAAAQRGIGVVLSPGKHVYLDMKYDADHPLGQDWAGTVDVRQSYEWDPDTYLPELPATAVRGVEAAIWTEFIATEDELFSMLLPRLVAIAELAWSPQRSRSWESFAPRLAAHAPLWTAAGVAFHESEQVWGRGRTDVAVA